MSRTTRICPSIYKRILHVVPATADDDGRMDGRKGRIRAIRFHLRVTIDGLCGSLVRVVRRRLRVGLLLTNVWLHDGSIPPTSALGALCCGREARIRSLKTCFDGTRSDGSDASTLELARTGTCSRMHPKACNVRVLDSSMRSVFLACLVLDAWDHASTVASDPTSLLTFASSPIHVMEASRGRDIHVHLPNRLGVVPKPWTSAPPSLSNPSLERGEGRPFGLRFPIDSEGEGRRKGWPRRQRRWTWRRRHGDGACAMDGRRRRRRGGRGACRRGQDGAGGVRAAIRRRTVLGTRGRGRAGARPRATAQAQARQKSAFWDPKRTDPTPRARAGLLGRKPAR
eukprot:scaffold148_cov341-Pavlova_lutheri.AAC.36